MGELWQEVIAMIATIAWSGESVIQIFANYRLKNVEGYSINYFILAINSSIFYSIYSITGYISPTEQTGTVVLGDMLFSSFNTLCLFVELYQFIIYPSGKNKISGKVVGLVSLIWLIILFNVIFTQVSISWSQIFGIIGSNLFWNAISLLGYGKLLISFVKYLPAIYWNYKRKSTKGWPALKTILDLIGGIFSLISGTISTENGLNIVKLALAILTLVYDIIILIQAFILYPNPSSNIKSEGEESKPLA